MKHPMNVSLLGSIVQEARGEMPEAGLENINSVKRLPRPVFTWF